jgi:hypothetical protein
VPRKADPNAPARPKRETEYEMTARKGEDEETIVAKTKAEAKGYIKAAAHFGFEVTEVVQVTKLDLAEFSDDATLTVPLSDGEATATA